MSRRVLVADDSATIQKVIKIAFSRHELEIVEAASMIEALAAVTRSGADALILDASLPGSRGPDDFVKLRDEAGAIPVLLLVGTYDSVDEEAFRRVGFRDFLKKPFESTDIVAAIDGMLGGGSASASETTPPPPLGRPQHPTVIVAGGAFPDSEGAPVGDPPPPPMTDQARKGRRAFSEGEDTAPSRAGAGSDEATDPRRGGVPRAGVPLPPIPPSVGFGTGLGIGKGADSSTQERTARRPAADPGAAKAAIDEALPALVRQAVEDYCDRHFKSLARDVIATELRRLADEKARHLVDN